MNKLNDLLSNVAKLAVQKPNAQDLFDWNSRTFEKAADTWYRRLVVSTGTALFIDLPNDILEKRGDSYGDTAVIWCARTMPAKYCLPENWRRSQRFPSDLGQTDEEILGQFKVSDSVLDFQKAALCKTNSEAWLASQSMDTVVAPFLMNCAGGTARDLALQEISRVLSIGGFFETIVLVADEALETSSMDFDGVECTTFPREDAIEALLLKTGLHGITLSHLLDEPVITVGGVEIRAFSVQATTGTKGACLDQGDAAIYLGPWSKVLDDDGHEYPRGVRIAVCAKTASVLQRDPYAGSFMIIKAYGSPALEDAPLFDCSQDVIRPVAETKGLQPIGGASANILSCTDEDCGC